jgi:hypothetical protein
MGPELLDVARLCAEALTHCGMRIQILLATLTPLGGEPVCGLEYRPIPHMRCAERAGKGADGAVAVLPTGNTDFFVLGQEHACDRTYALYPFRNLLGRKSAER